MTCCRNLITDVPGLRVGNAQDAAARTGVTVLLPEAPAVAAVDVRGGGPGTRETDAIALPGTVAEIHALVLSGGSAFGLSAASAVQHVLSQRGIGFAVGTARVPIVPQAILFDLLNGSEPAKLDPALYQRLATAACAAATSDFEIGSAGAGYGATTATLRGGLGSASACLENGTTVGALVAVNAAGSATVGDARQFWAAAFERDAEFGGLPPQQHPPAALPLRLKGQPHASTTLAVVATDARLTKTEAFRLAVMAQTGLARAIYPVHTPLDGDVVFALSTGQRPLPDPYAALARLGALAADTLARAVARGIWEAAACPEGFLGPPAHRTRFARPGA